MSITTLPLALFFVSIVLFPSPSFARQGPTPSCDIPLVVTRFNASTGYVEFVKDLGMTDFRVSAGGVPASLQSVSIDDGPKRIALILDGSQGITAEEWNLETEMAAYLVEQGRPKDQFLLLYVGIEGAGDSFLSSGEADEQIRKLEFSRPATVSSDERNFDAVLAAATHLDPPMFGDTLFLFGHPEDAGSRADPEQVLELLLKRQLRFYGVSFHDPLEARLTPDIDLNKPLPPKLLALASPKLAQMSAETGYFFSFRSIRSLNMPGQTRSFRGFLTDLYSGIEAPYRLKLSASDLQGRAKLEISIADSEVRKIRKSDIHYPRSIFPCSSPAASRP